jgi:hypothetical protein
MKLGIRNLVYPILNHFFACCLWFQCKKLLLRWFISNCSGNANLLKLLRGQVYDILIVKTEKKVGVTELVSKIWQMPPFPDTASSWSFHEVQEQSQLLNRYWILNFFNKDLTKNIYLVIIYKKTWYCSESKTIDVHCRGAKMSFPIFSDMLFWKHARKCKIL